MKYPAILILCFVTASLSAQSAPAYLGYGVENLPATNVFTSEVPLGVLFDPANVARFTSPEGKAVLGQVDKKTLQGNTLTVLLSAKVDKKPALKMTLRFTIKDAEDIASMTYIKVTNVVDGQFTQAEYDGTDYSFGRILGIFGGIAPVFLNVEKINKLSQ